MNTQSYLFDMEPYSVTSRRRGRSFSPGLRQAFARLRKTMDAIPREEWEFRKRRVEALERALRQG